MVDRTATRAALAALAVAAAVGGGAAAQDGTATGGDRFELRDTFGAWDVRCAGGVECVMTQTAFDTQGRPFFRIVINKLPEARDTGGGTVVALSSITVPLGVFLPSGINMRIDDREFGSVSFITCGGGGCQANPPLDPSLVEAMKAGGVAAFKIRVAQPDGTTSERDAEISLSGFTAAYDSL